MLFLYFAHNIWLRWRAFNVECDIHLFLISVELNKYLKKWAILYISAIHEKYLKCINCEDTVRFQKMLTPSTIFYFFLYSIQLIYNKSLAAKYIHEQWIPSISPNSGLPQNSFETFLLLELDFRSSYISVWFPESNSQKKIWFFRNLDFRLERLLVEKLKRAKKYGILNWWWYRDFRAMYDVNLAGGNLPRIGFA